MQDESPLPKGKYYQTLPTEENDDLMNDREKLL